MENLLCERLAKLLKEKNMTQKKLSELSGVTESAICHYIKGDRIPRSIVLSKIASALGVSSDYLALGYSASKEEDLKHAAILIARNTNQMTLEEKKKILEILMDTNR